MAVHVNGAERLEINPESLDEGALNTIHRLLELCVHTQRRLDAANLHINDSQLLRKTTMIMNDIRAYRRVLIENMIVTFEPHVYLESLRIVEKGMQIVESGTDQVCLIAGNGCNN